MKNSSLKFVNIDNCRNEDYNKSVNKCGHSLMAESWLPKPVVRVRFPLPAPDKIKISPTV